MLHQIGAGVLGPVFRAYQPAPGRLVAIKQFRLGLPPDAAERFVAALDRIVAADLTHPGIATPVAAGMTETSPYLALDFVAAESFDVVMRDTGPAPATDVLVLARQIAGALDAAAAVGVVHGALHPRDVLMADDLRVTGLGIAHALEGVGLAAPIRRPYAAPERTAGAPWDRRADIFSLAALTYEMLAGRRVGALGRDVADSVPSIDGADVDRLGAAFARGLAEKPTDRFGSALEFADALENAFALRRSRTGSTPRRRAGGEVVAGGLELPLGLSSDASIDGPDDAFTEDGPVEVYTGGEYFPEISALDDRLTALANDDAEPGLADFGRSEPDLDSVDSRLDAAALAASADLDLNKIEAARVEQPEVTKPVEEPISRSKVQDHDVTEQPSVAHVADTRDVHALDQELLTLTGPAMSPARQLRDEPVVIGASVFESVLDRDDEPVIERESQPVIGRSDEPAIERDVELTVDPIDVESRDVESGDSLDDAVEASMSRSTPFSRPLPLGASDGASSSNWPILLGVVMGLLVGFAFGYGYGLWRVTGNVLSGASGTATASIDSSSPTPPPPSPPPVSLPQTPAPRAQTEAPTPEKDKPADTSAAASSPSAPAGGASRVPAGSSGARTSTPAAPVAPPTAAAGAPSAAAASGSSVAASTTTPAKPVVDGRLLIRTTPAGSRVTIDGHDAGITPLTTTLLPGSHLVRLAHQGYVGVDRRIRIGSAQPAQPIDVELVARPTRENAASNAVPERPSGSLVLDSRPTGARVFVDEALVGTTPLQIDAITSGDHAVRFELDGFGPWSTTARVAAGLRTRVSGSLER